MSQNDLIQVGDFRFGRDSIRGEQRDWHHFTHTEPFTLNVPAFSSSNERGRASMSKIRVLVVDDFEAWRRFICSRLAKNAELQIIGEASDGLEAVQRAEELQPDLIVLDLGLPKLNGIEAARQIRKVSSESKILFMTQEPSVDVAQAALSTGAMGYVLKTRAEIDLHHAVKAVLEGRQFVSSGLESPPSSDPT